ncbi:MAG TPA: phosphatidylserine decarboxylase [Pyrinomonadaceae bacterium]|nr:phosphatidylserine decarboxylase [Pyrinomonadaceae bacterium]
MIAREGIIFILPPVGLAILFFWLGLWPVGIAFILLAAFMAFFFRDPKREPPIDASVIVSPADGRVTRISALEEANENSATLVSIFLSPLNVHINRSPIAGEVTSVAYLRGKFVPATDARASVINEQNVLTIKGENITVVCKQIAGILARRIVCWKRAGDNVTLGERIGLIKFSSRTDLILPPNVEILVTVGTRVRGAITIIGRIR